VRVGSGYAASDASDSAADPSEPSDAACAADPPESPARAPAPLSRGATGAPTSAGLRETVALQRVGETPVAGGSQQQGQDGLRPGRVARGGQGLR